MVRVISITEALGSGGPEIARLTGDRMGMPVVDREVFLWAAQEAGVSPETIEEAERAPSFLE
ncbi:MAG TPA: cytidylate kinase family protein, partial [Chloroflexota bacterium]